MPKAFTNKSISQTSISIRSPWPGEALSKTTLFPSVKQIGSPYKGVQKNPHDQSVWEWQPCPGLAIIRPHECLSSPLLSAGALTVTHPAMTVTPAQRASCQQGPTTSNEAVKGPCSWTVATNTSWSSPTAQQQTPTAVLSASASTEKRCTAWTSFPSLQPLICLLPMSSSACVNLQPAKTQRTTKVFKNALWMHDKKEADTARGQKGYSTGCDNDIFSFTFSLSPSHTEIKVYNVWTSNVYRKANA